MIETLEREKNIAEMELERVLEEKEAAAFWIPIDYTRIRECTDPDTQNRCELLKVGDVLDLTKDTNQRFYPKISVSNELVGGHLGYLSFERGDPLLHHPDITNHFRAIVVKLTGREYDKPLRGVNIQLQRKVYIQADM